MGTARRSRSMERSWLDPESRDRRPGQGAKAVCPEGYSALRGMVSEERLPRLKREIAKQGGWQRISEVLGH